MVSVVPANEISDVAKNTAHESGSSRVKLLKEGDHMRVWTNQGETHYLTHLVVR